MDKLKVFANKIKKSFFILFIIVSSFFFLNFSDNLFEVSKNLEIFHSIIKELNINYVDQIEPGKIISNAIDGMLESLDPYTNYIQESDVEDYKFMTTGQYGGIGAMIFSKEGLPVISEVYLNTPANKNDLQPGDVILEIDGKSTKEKDPSDISSILRGQVGTNVKILVKRETINKTFELNIKREEIKLDNIPYYGLIDDNIGYIKLNSFTQNATNEVRDALNALKSSYNIKSLIFDLRDNGGGLLHESVFIANLFVEKDKLIVSTKGKNQSKNQVYTTPNNPIEQNMPVVFLVNRRSASASEVLSGSMQDLDRAVIIGERTFGKGLVQNIVPLDYNSQLKVTIAKYYIPSGRCIQAIDYSNRNEDGSVGKIPDSLVTAYKTKNGRVVYDGGGITPDIVLKPVNISKISTSLILKRLIFDYATLFKSKNSSIKEINQFEIGDVIYDDFIAFLDGKDYDYVTDSETNLEELKKAAEEEKYFDKIQKDYEVLYDKIKHNKEADLHNFKEEIKDLLKEEIASRYYFQKGRIQISLLNDPYVKKAIPILKNTKTYEDILTGKYKEDK
ncbi:MAG: peptidase S41 [Bacteroidetes bacterium GWE2_29_8]|nr:MAG: peptidase S41 [Bacteroidetes bacterium GWE2_29_8]OFY24843.1 MAG: peptidase S41 [Bacteroidetes bacterium GWF2_29_10]